MGVAHGPPHRPPDPTPAVRGPVHDHFAAQVTRCLAATPEEKPDRPAAVSRLRGVAHAAPLHSRQRSPGAGGRRRRAAPGPPARWGAAPGGGRCQEALAGQPVGVAGVFLQPGVEAVAGAGGLVRVLLQGGTSGDRAGGPGEDVRQGDVQRLGQSGQLERGDPALAGLDADQRRAVQADPRGQLTRLRSAASRVSVTRSPTSSQLCTRCMCVRFSLPALRGTGRRRVTPVGGCGQAQSRPRVSRGSATGPSPTGWPDAAARSRSSSTLNSRPSSTAMWESHSHTRKTTTVARLP